MPSPSPSSSFEAYEQLDSQTTLAYLDKVIGGDNSQDEDETTALNGKLVTVAYQARLMANGKQFDQSQGYVFRIGDGKVIPGWEQGIVVRVPSYIWTYFHCRNGTVWRLDSWLRGKTFRHTWY